MTHFDSCLSNLYESHLRKLFGEVVISVMNQHKERIKFQFQFPSWFDLVFDSKLKTTRRSWVPMFINQRSVQYDNSCLVDFLEVFLTSSKELTKTRFHCFFFISINLSNWFTCLVFKLIISSKFFRITLNIKSLGVCYHEFLSFLCLNFAAVFQRCLLL